MKKFFLCGIFFIALIVYSCVPPAKKGVKIVYNFLSGKTYIYNLSIKGRGNFSYLLFSYSGDFSVNGEVVVSFYSNTLSQKAVTFSVKIYTDNSLESFNSFLSLERFSFSFFMDEKGQKVFYGEYNPFIEMLLDLFIPVLPNLSLNDFSTRMFNYKIENLSLRNELNKTTVVKEFIGDDFTLSVLRDYSMLELENVDIMVGKISNQSIYVIKDGIISESYSYIGSRTTIPLKSDFFTQVIGFKGETTVVMKLREKI